MNKAQNKPNIFITGSTRGLGLSLARHFAKKSYNIILHDISAAACGVYGEANSVDEILKELRSCNIKAEFFAGDITKEDAVKELVSEVEKSFGRIDILINNVGGDVAGRDDTASGGKAPQNTCFISTDNFFSIFDRNFLTCFHVCRAVAPGMIRQGDGKIINIASVSAAFGTKTEVAYSVAKSAVIHWTRCLAAELRPHGINVNCIAPSGITTGRFKSTPRPPQDLEKMAAKTKLERLAEPQDITNVLDFLAGDLSNYISGQVLRVDGGQFLTPI